MGCRWLLYTFDSELRRRTKLRFKLLKGDRNCIEQIGRAMIEVAQALSGQNFGSVTQFSELSYLC